MMMYRYIDLDSDGVAWIWKKHAEEMKRMNSINYLNWLSLSRMTDGVGDPFVSRLV